MKVTKCELEGVAYNGLVLFMIGGGLYVLVFFTRDLYRQWCEGLWAKYGIGRKVVVLAVHALCLLMGGASLYLGVLLVRDCGLKLPLH